MTKTAAMNVTAFALSLGRHDKLTHEASAPFRAEYATLEGDAKRQYKLDWTAHYLIGRLDVDAAKAAKMAEKGTQGLARAGKGKDTYNAIKTAWRLFAYHITGEGKAKDGAAQVDVVAQLVAKFGKLTAAQQRRFLKEIAA